MAFKKYVVVAQSIKIAPGQLVKGLTENQLRRRKDRVKKSRGFGNVYECIAPFEFKRGEIVCLEASKVAKSLLEEYSGEHEETREIGEPEAEKKTELGDEKAAAPKKGRPKKR